MLSRFRAREPTYQGVQSTTKTLSLIGSNFALRQTEVDSGTRQAHLSWEPILGPKHNLHLSPLCAAQGPRQSACFPHLPSRPVIA